MNFWSFKNFPKHNKNLGFHQLRLKPEWDNKLVQNNAHRRKLLVLVQHLTIDLLENSRYRKRYRGPVGRQNLY